MFANHLTYRVALVGLVCCGLFGAVFATTLVAGEAAVFWASDPVQPGQAAMLIGSGFAEEPELEVAGLSDSSEGSYTPVEALQASGTSVKFVVPKDLPPGVFKYRLKTATGSLSGVLNRPRLWWLLGDAGTRATPGGSVRLFGKNLLVAGASTEKKTTVELQGPRNLTLPAAAETYTAEVQLPADLPEGQYRLTLRNGHGGKAVSSESLPLEVRARKPWPSTVFDVTETGAVGDGVKDDTLAIAAALQKAGEASGGVVYFPRGRYRISATLEVPRFTVLRGEKQSLVALAWTSFPDPPEALVRGTNSFGLEDLTLYAKEHRHIIVGDLGREPEAGDVFLHRVRIRASRFRGHPDADRVDELFRRSLKMAGASRGDAVRLGGTNVEITDCDFYGSGRSLFLSRVRGGRVEGNRLFNGRRGWYCISGSDGLVFADNEVCGADLQSSGGGLNCLDGSSYSQNVYFAHNRLSLMHGWDREAMTSDAGGGAYFGKIASCDGTRLVLAEEPNWGRRSWAGAGVFLLDGRGAGQYRRIVRCEGNNVEIDRPWQVEPDEDSLLTITMFQGHYVLVDNEFSDTGAVQFYGISIENIVAGNKGTRMPGFSCLGLCYHGYQPSWYCQMLGNTLCDGNYYHWHSAARAGLKVFGANRAPYEGPLNRAAVVRGNRLESNAMIRVYGASRDTIVEGNHVALVDQGIFVSEKAASVLVRDNTFDEVPHPLVDEPAMRAAELERMKRFIGCKTPVAVWHFDEGFVGGFADSSGNGFHAKVAGEGEFTLVDDAVCGRAIRFSGSNYLRVEEPAVFNAPNISVCLWIKPDMLSGRRGLLVKRFGNTAAPFAISQNEGGIRVAATEADGPWSFNFNSPDELAKDAWNHVGVVFTEGQGVAIYLNGKLVAEKANPAARVISREPLILGREAWGGDPPDVKTPGLYAGLLDEVKVWTRSLSAEEIQADAAALKQAKP